MRQSLATKRASQGGSLSSQANITATTTKLLEKMKEFDAVSALESASALYLERIQGLSEDCDIMADAGQVHGQVLEQWPRMFQILNLFLDSRQACDEHGNTGELPPSEGEQLVRIPIEDLQQISPDNPA